MQIGCISFALTLLTVFLFPGYVSAQNVTAHKKQLTPSARVQKIAFIDHSRLNREYRVFADARHKLALQSEAEKQSLTKELSVIDLQTNDVLKKDSLHRTKKQQQLIDNVSLKRTELYSEFQSAQQKRNQSRLALMKEYELKIASAITMVVAEGGYTDVKPLDKNSASQRGTNITDLVLKKLN